MCTGEFTYRVLYLICVWVFSAQYWTGGSVLSLAFVVSRA